MTEIAIVGAGVSGLAAAYGLRTLPVDVTVFEKSRGYGGRAATRGRHGCRYDHGASYFTTPTDRLQRLVQAHLPTDGLLKIGRSIWQFDREGDLHRPSAADDIEPKWTYRQGINRLGKLLAWKSDAQVHTETPVERLKYDGQQWGVVTHNSTHNGSFDGVVLTPPAPQALTILQRSTADAETIRRLQQAVGAVSYMAQFSYVFGYNRAVHRPGDFYALSSTDQDHPVDWIAFEHLKPGHVQSGHNVIVVQTAPSWTAARLDDDPADFVHDILEMAEDVIVTDLRHPAWFDVQTWRYARPLESLEGGMGSECVQHGLFLAGDYITGEGSVAAALESGVRAAQSVRQWSASS